MFFFCYGIICYVIWSDNMKYLFGYLFIINLISLIIYAVDKFSATRNANRVRESILLFSGFIGGALGSLISMILFRHKTRKKRFVVLNILFLLMWCYLTYMFYRNG